MGVHPDFMKIKVIAAVVLLAGILGAAFYLRQSTFWAPHWDDEERKNAALSMKLGEQLDFAGYNLSQIRTQSITLRDPAGARVIYPYWDRDIPSDAAFSHHPPIFPMLLTWSHLRLAGFGERFAVVQTNPGTDPQAFRAPVLFKLQIWAVIVPLTAGLLALIGTFFWTRSVFGLSAALIAALILAVNPVSVLASSRLWPQELTALLVILAMSLYEKGCRQNRLWICSGAGLAMGFAVMADTAALFVIAGLFVFTFLAARSEGQKNLWNILWDRRWVVFVAAAALMSHKYLQTLQFYHGTPVVMPSVQDPGIPHLGWVLLLGLITFKETLRSLRLAWSGRVTDLAVVFCWCWIAAVAVYAVCVRASEPRYLIPAYPALAALSAHAVVSIAGRLRIRKTS